MIPSKREDFVLKCGNLVLALLLSTVPVGITIAILGAHGTLLCRRLEQRIDQTLIKKYDLRERCQSANIDELYKYVLWIWIFITIPTWRWFYVGHVRRVKSGKL